VSRRSGTAVNIKRDTEVLETLLDEVMIAINHLLYGNSLFLGTDSNRYTMLIATADEDNILLLEAEIANIDIGWHVYTCQVTDVHTTVGIRQSRSHGSTFKVLLFHIS
jgi:hypothetical protein